MENKKELNDEQLEKVNGGGYGTIPAEGITFSAYSGVTDRHYYAKGINDFDSIVYVYKAWDGTLQFTREKFKVNEANNEWTSYNRTQNGEYVPENFESRYPYILNVQPK